MKRGVIWFAGFTAVFAATMAYVFWGTWSPEVAFIQPDCAIVYPADFLWRRWLSFCNGGPIVPGDIRYLLGGPFVWQELQFALAMYLAALGAAYYLKGRGLPPLACYGAGAAYGFMGYNLTLFSAGHLGWFELMMYAPFCFGLIDRCVRKGRWVNWALLGGLLAWGASHQPDIWLLFAAFAFVYGLYRLVRCVLGQNTAAERCRVAGRILLGVLVAGAVTVAAGWPQLSDAIFVQTANRDLQISGATGSPDAAGDARGQKSEDVEKRYVFCTNWSLPPDETLEFVVPDVNGGSSDMRVSPRNPYRGRIGMQYAPGRWTPYRQHSLYMGAITVLLALVGAFGAFRRRGGLDHTQDGAVPPGNRAEIIFWTVSAAVVLLVSFGGFTPFYRLVFMLPMGNYIRCPLKFVHLLEWCLAILAGFGVAGILSSKLASRASSAVSAALLALLLVNMFNLAAVDARYCAVDVGDTIRIAIARRTGSDSVGFATDATSKIDDLEYVFAGGLAFRDNEAVKKGLASGDLKPVSFWTVHGGRPVETARERASFALLKSVRFQRKEEGRRTPGVSGLISLIATCALCAAGVLKAVRRS